MSSNFTFKHDDQTYTFEHGLGRVRKPGFIRKNRRLDEVDLLFTILEEVAGDECLAVVDTMDEDEFTALAKSLQDALGQGANLGE